ncbi:unnamed protein product [Amoebophrya sp. A25]|nr:unnamed protein product [Amoebophrya sp. A25]|eukprot:GSA25T00000189001.1
MRRSMKKHPPAAGTKRRRVSNSFAKSSSWLQEEDKSREHLSSESQVANVKKGRSASIVEMGAGLGYWAAFLDNCFDAKAARRPSSSSRITVRAFDVMPHEGGRNLFKNELGCTRTSSTLSFSSSSKTSAPGALSGTIRRIVERCREKLTDDTTAKEALASANALLLSFPPPGETMASDALSFFRGDLLVYVGEWATGMTADAAFHESIIQDFDFMETVPLPQWATTCYAMFLFRRKRTPSSGVRNDNEMNQTPNMTQNKEPQRTGTCSILERSIAFKPTTTSASSSSASLESATSSNKKKKAAKTSVLTTRPTNPRKAALSCWVCTSCGSRDLSCGASSRNSKTLSRFTAGNRSLVACSEQCQSRLLREDLFTTFYFGKQFGLSSVGARSETERRSTTSAISKVSGVGAREEDSATEAYEAADSRNVNKQKDAKMWEPLAFTDYDEERAYNALALATPKA